MWPTNKKYKFTIYVTYSLKYYSISIKYQMLLSRSNQLIY